MSKSKWSADFRTKVAQEYLDGKGSFYYLANKYHIGRATIQKWVTAYKVHGIDAFICAPGNASYTSEFKTMCVEEVISGYGSSVDIGAKYKVYPSVLESWIRMYNANRKLKDYDPKREVYMAEAKRKTTMEERKKIVTYCIEHNHDYKGTATLYDEEGLADRRGRHKTDDEVDELERLRRENLRLKRQLEEKDMVVELLKKVKEFERM